MRTLAFLVAALLLQGCAGAAPAPTARPTSVLGERDSTHALTHDTVPRSYVLHVPPDVTNKGPLPLIVAYHGDGGSPEGAIRQFGLSALADREGLLVAYPQADRGIWNDAS